MQRRIRLAAGVLACALLAACSSSAEGNTPAANFATVTGAGRTVSPPDGLQRTQYPNPCVLLPQDSVEVLVSTQVRVSRNSIACTWSPTVASAPSVSVAYVEIGSDAGTVYDQPIARNSDAAALSGVGRLARIYTTDSQHTIRADVLKGNVFFRVEVRTSTTAAQDVANARAIAIRVAQLVAQQIG